MEHVNISIRPSHRDVNIKTIRPLAACSRLVVWKNRKLTPNASTMGILLIFAALTPSLARAELTAEELAKIAQNPVANLINVPFQNNSNFNFGPEEKTQNVLNIQPVIPVSINKDWNLITRTIVPVISQPELGPNVGSQHGIGDTVFTAFVSPANPGQWIFAAGPVVQLPTHNSKELGNDNWGMGPSFLAMHLDHGDPWVYGVLMNNVWSLSKDKGNDGSYNDGLLQPFVNYNFKGGLYVKSAPELTVNWKARSSDQWTVPLGGGVGKIIHLGKLPLNSSIEAYYNVEKPEFGSDWTLRATLTLMFPK